MDTVQTILLALLQGLTEFLPISSSAHLILLPRLLGWEDQGLAFDVAVHVGTLLAVILYFREDVRRLLLAWFASIVNRQMSADAWLAWLVVLGTVPVALAGLLLGDVIETHLRSPMVIALATIGFGVLLGVADLRGRQARREDSLSVVDVIWIGLAQALALIPGTSRSGITMTAALALGLTRSAAARFSFLLSIPIIASAGALKFRDLVNSSAAVDWGMLGMGVLIVAAFGVLLGG